MASKPIDPRLQSQLQSEDLATNDDVPPAYNDLDIHHDGRNIHSQVAGQFSGLRQPLGLGLIKEVDDGRLDIHIDTSEAGLVRPQTQLATGQGELETLVSPPYTPLVTTTGSTEPPPALNIVIHVVGSRGDVQPFVALGRELKDKYGHRIRLATHQTFKKFVEENGLEFFDIGGDPAELMAFMVKNPGLIPGMKSLKAGDVGKRRKGMAEILQGCWRSCADADEAKEHGGDEPETKPFVANAIIANPPSFAHIHCAEKLGIPLHLMFT